jgi:hypothetical protein
MVRLCVASMLLFALRCCIPVLWCSQGAVAVNGIGDSGAQALAKALESNCTLTELNLYGMDRI